MSEIVERVARAMAAAITKQPRSGATFDKTPSLMIADDDSNSFWELLPVARAAIEAMREPTQDMTDAAVSSPIGDDEADGHNEAWRSMIDAALGQVDA